MNECQEVSSPEDIRRKIEEHDAVARGDLWERMGCPVSKLHMPIDEYLKSFRGRHWFATKQVMQEAQMTLRIIICPKCIKEVNYGIEGTQFYASVEDDVMTVFPAMGHFLCHWCGFEEYHPLKSDPRVRRFGDAELDRDKRTFVNQINPGQGLGSAIGGPMFGSAGLANQQRGMSATEMQIRSQQAQHAYAEASKAMHEAIGKGVEPGMGPIWGMTEDERRALYRLAQRSKTSPPPSIVESKAEAEALAKLPAVERRQFVIQKLRDLGMLKP